MTPLMHKFHLMCLFFMEMVCRDTVKATSSLRRDNSFKSANVGDDVTLPCFDENNESIKFYWYKQTLGERPQMITSSFNNNKTYLHGEFKDDTRFKVQSGNGVNHLSISDIRLSDSATYFCASSYSFEFTFVQGTFLSVKGSGFSVQTIVQPAPTLVGRGDGETIDCMVFTGGCDKEGGVFLFRTSEDSPPGILYTDAGRCEMRGGPETQSCVYTIPTKGLDRINTETYYYCALVACGVILFGNGTRFGITPGKGEHPIYVYFMSAALVFTTTLVFILACCLCKMSKRHSGRGPHPEGSAPATPNKGVQETEGLHYATVRVSTSGRSRQRDATEAACVYSSVRHWNRPRAAAQQKTDRVTTSKS